MGSLEAIARVELRNESLFGRPCHIAAMPTSVLGRPVALVTGVKFPVSPIAKPSMR